MSHHAPPEKREKKKKGKAEAYDANIHGHVQSAKVKCELHHDILKKKEKKKKKKDVHIPNTDHAHVAHVCSDSGPWQLWLLNEQRRADESLSRTDGWMFVHNMTTGIALNLSKHVKTTEA